VELSAIWLRFPVLRGIGDEAVVRAAQQSSDPKRSEKKRQTEHRLDRERKGLPENIGEICGGSD
jgi:hypothetical protein